MFVSALSVWFLPNICYQRQSQVGDQFLVVDVDGTSIMLSVPGSCSSDRTTSYRTNERKTELGANIDIMKERTANTLCFSCVGRVVLCWMLVFIFSLLSSVATL